LEQVLLNTLIRGGELSLLAIGVTMVYGTLRFPNFAHVEFATAGAYLALFFSGFLGLDLVLAGVLAIVLTAGIGVASDTLIFRHLRVAHPVMPMIASFGLGIAIREAVRGGAGTSPFFLSQSLAERWTVLGATITDTQVLILVLVLIAVVGFHLLLTRTRLGIAMRAVSDNSDLARASGIFSERIIRLVWLIGAAMAALGGILIGLETQLQPNMGIGLIIAMFAAALLGGIGNPYGAVLGAFVVAFAENIILAVNWAWAGQLVGMDIEYAMIPTGYKEAISFVVLILVLLVRPRGILGDPSR
jgi:branched-subunit amino acid ABC-type transport system permease component